MNFLNKSSDIEIIIKKNIEEISKNVNIPINAPLVKSGYISSLYFLELIIIMEKHFKINIDPFELTSEDLLSISSISKFIYGKLNKK